MKTSVPQNLGIHTVISSFLSSTVPTSSTTSPNEYNVKKDLVYQGHFGSGILFICYTGGMKTSSFLISRKDSRIVKTFLILLLYIGYGLAIASNVIGNILGSNTYHFSSRVISPVISWVTVLLTILLPFFLYKIWKSKRTITIAIVTILLASFPISLIILDETLSRKNYDRYLQGITLETCVNNKNVYPWGLGYSDWRSCFVTLGECEYIEFGDTYYEKSLEKRCLDNSKKQCPEEHIVNKMPGGERNPDGYYILGGERREGSEFDSDWIKDNCDISTQVVY